MPVLDINLWPFTQALLVMIICMAFSGILVAFITRRLPNALSRPLIYLAPFAGGYVYFNYIYPYFA